jgi:hypothetical protein
MGDNTDILRKARKVIERLAPIGVCGPCTAELVDGASLDAVQIGLSELAADRDFERENAACGLCGEHRLAIRKRR